MGEAAERRRHRQVAWTSKVFRAPHTLEAIERDALYEWAAMQPVERLALAWKVSLEQYLGDVTTSDFAIGGSGFRMGAPPFRIELLTERSGVAFADAWPSRETYDLDGTRGYVISRADLITNKRAAGRPQDIADVDILEPQSARNPEPGG